MTTAAPALPAGVSDPADLERRLQRLEQSVAELSRQLRRMRGPAKDPKWYINGAGRFANDPLFDEMVRAGREYRESLRPKQGKKSAKTNVRKSRATSRQRKDSRARP